MGDVLSVTKANEYIAEHQAEVNPLYKPEAHFTAPIGWINDPNGLVYFREEYHLFYQYYPYGTQWGPMHWGHAKSKDLLHWEHLPVALAPDQSYDKDGCFSGSAIVKDDVLWLMYTGHIVNADGSISQVQNMAFSKDGIQFEKLDSNPVATGEMLPEELIASDFRDPKLFEKNGHYYAVVAAKHREDVGTIVLLESPDLVNWNFASIFLKGEPHQGFMWECPDYFELDEVSCLAMSPMRYEKTGLDYANINSSVIMTGRVDWDKKVFELETVKEIDHGHDFYAPQSLENAAGERIMIAWMQTWGRTNITDQLDHKWACAMTLPRKLKWDNGVLVQELPASLLEQLPVLSEQGAVEVGYFQGDWSGGKVFRLGSEADYIEFGYDAERQEVYIDRSSLKQAIQGEEAWSTERRAVQAENPHVLVVLDTNSIELFVNGGQDSLTSTYFLSGQRQLVTY
ncbi:sucrose-6-phosphate hydrolase [Streptococcus sp. zg-86]|uniref:Sucrose-6-phosphate hydrolase n=1 Tax=Streptococcus zhangguiae TaxID=2664091 RepID=A0A6I4RDK8_9STRE|nr:MULTISPECIES: glycoside hydrolase family 32 protein [unclassified Streptococcus]MTB63703.1 sucrose-6-phosphate hydrolase [Streptococcus sp. zg-86]MTB90013.1 sucrose-6-phosphate hydrolase [Streptococcus sp. zg-36]MWV55684.1 sucrose-6-phosphate hydrolase [Streptococcus sp. zg-70]QTH48023.1 glycoside hydrolase family 32 protein [Streptococcus sp. zg-86]